MQSASDLTARARERAEGMTQAANGIPAPPYDFRSWQYDDWGMVRNADGPVASTSTQAIISRWKESVYDKLEGDPRPAWKAGPPETKSLGEFLVYAANNAGDIVSLLRALADDRERLLAEGAELKETIASKNKILDHISPVLLTIVNWMDGRISDQVLTEALAQKGA